ncbi:RidA family protein [Pararhodobacter zhoushanensis]|uniref:RidA family protein n=1 Tax=Pararhodobacter zhoushanensis TaxID=2479545 RepID=A0ABT3GX81_9RHOB|nr:RidA family protein [Pararhodobacter zhoushanensis]MCW1932113.1 RidA family protein [Pararhodobacter zhoushanensis]
MPPKAIIPPGSGDAVRQLALSPGVLSGGHLFLTGMTGSAPTGEMPVDPEAQFSNAFDKIGAVLAEAGLGFDAVVEMTTYHVGLRDHFDTFAAVRRHYVQDPFPAWTAVEVAGLRRDGALVEIRVIASAETLL